MAASMEKRAQGEKEGIHLLGPPTFAELQNGRFKCVETGHEMLARDRESYSGSRRCRVGLIDFALAHQKPPLNMFKQDPLCRSKMICKLTGDIVNKSDEHIWKHINGRRFLNKLEQKEAEDRASSGSVNDEGGNRSTSHKESRRRTEISDQIKKRPEKSVHEIKWEMRDSSGKDSKDQLDSSSETRSESDGDDETSEDFTQESEEISIRTKRLSIEVGPSSFAPRKKKSKKNSPS